MGAETDSDGRTPLLNFSSRLQRTLLAGKFAGLAAAGVLASCFMAAGWGAALGAQVHGPGGEPQASDGPLLLTLEGRGVQVYRCDGTSAAAGWVLDHPEADLLDSRRKVVGHHDAGPSWRLEDGSSVKGEVIQKTEADEPRAIPWLVLRATAHQGTGLLAGVETIRRTKTHGGVAPVQGCDGSMAGATVRVPYTALYTFYGKP
jgi:hypothetical protein